MFGLFSAVTCKIDRGSEVHRRYFMNMGVRFEIYLPLRHKLLFVGSSVFTACKGYIYLFTNTFIKTAIKESSLSLAFDTNSRMALHFLSNFYQTTKQTFCALFGTWPFIWLLRQTLWSVWPMLSSPGLTLPSIYLVTSISGPSWLTGLLEDPIHIGFSDAKNKSFSYQYLDGRKLAKFWMFARTVFCIINMSFDLKYTSSLLRE